MSTTGDPTLCFGYLLAKRCKILVQARPLILALFFIYLAVIGLELFINAKAIFRTGAVVAQVALFLFLLTESFGSVAQKRSRTTRSLARVFLGVSGLVVAGVLGNVLREVIS